MGRVEPLVAAAAAFCEFPTACTLSDRSLLDCRCSRIPTASIMAAKSRDFSLPAGMAPPAVGSAAFDVLLDDLSAAARTATAERPADGAEGAQLPSCQHLPVQDHLLGSCTVRDGTDVNSVTEARAAATPPAALGSCSPTCA